MIKSHVRYQLRQPDMAPTGELESPTQRLTAVCAAIAPRRNIGRGGEIRTHVP